MIFLESISWTKVFKDDKSPNNRGGDGDNEVGTCTEVFYISDTWDTSRMNEVTNTFNGCIHDF